MIGELEKEEESEEERKESVEEDGGYLSGVKGSVMRWIDYSTRVESFSVLFCLLGWQKERVGISRLRDLNS